MLSGDARWESMSLLFYLLEMELLASLDSSCLSDLLVVLIPTHHRQEAFPLYKEPRNEMGAIEITKDNLCHIKVLHIVTHADSHWRQPCASPKGILPIAIREAVQMAGVSCLLGPVYWCDRETLLPYYLLDPGTCLLLRVPPHSRV